MNETALVTLFGDTLVSDGRSLRGVVLDDKEQPMLGITLARRALINAPAGYTLFQTSPTLYQLRDEAGRPYSHAPDGTRDMTHERQSWSELSCLLLRRFPFIPEAETASSPIPRLLHFTCNDQNTLHPAFKANIAHIAKMNPGWEVMIWDEAARYQFISDVYGWEVLKIYLMIGQDYGAAKADFFRYLVIYKLGGVYLDLKSSMSRPLDAILRSDDEFLLTQWNMSGSGKHKNWGISQTIAFVKGGEYPQWFVIGRPGHPYLRRVIQLVMTKILTYRPDAHGIGMVTTFNLTGPHAYTKAIYPVRQDYAHRIFDAETEGLIYSVIENHRALSGSDYRLAQTLMVTGNDAYRL